MSDASKSKTNEASKHINVSPLSIQSLPWSPLFISAIIKCSTSIYILISRYHNPIADRDELCVIAALVMFLFPLPYPITNQAYLPHIIK